MIATIRECGTSKVDVHQTGLEEAFPNSIATINTKLVEGESAVFQQILSTGVDWITPDVLKLIAHKGEELMNEGKVTELPAASAYDTFIIPSKSKPTKPHIVVEYANGKLECQVCPRRIGTSSHNALRCNYIISFVYHVINSFRC